MAAARNSFTNKNCSTPACGDSVINNTAQVASCGVCHSVPLTERSYDSLMVYHGIVLVLAIFVLAGNLLTILALRYSGKLKTRTGTFITNLAVTDLLLGLGMLIYAALGLANQKHFIQDKIVCFIYVSGVISLASASMYCLLMVTLERFFGTTFPLKYKTLLSGKVVALMLAAPWIRCAIAVACIAKYMATTWRPDQVCGFVYVTPGHYVAVVLLETLLTLAFSVFLYVKILRTSNIAPAVNQTHRRNLRMMRMIIVLVGTFTLCWLPCAVFMAVVKFCALCIREHTFLLICYQLVAFLTFCNSGINPVLYGILNRNFRHAYLLVIHHLCCSNTPTSDPSMSQSYNPVKPLIALPQPLVNKQCENGNDRPVT